MSLKEKTIFDLNFCVANKQDIRSHIQSLSNHQKPSSVIFANSHVIVESHWDSRFKQQLQNASALIADGMPLAKLLNTTRYSGPDFMIDFIEQTKEARHFFIGSTPEVLKKIEAQFEGIQCGSYAPPFEKEFSEAEKQKHLKLINDFKADYIWIGLGAPKQEKYAIEMAQKPGSRGVWLAVGAAFDFISGQKPRAPQWMQSVGLEWAFRMGTEPKRLSLRYLKTNPIFVALALKELTQRKKQS